MKYLFSVLVLIATCLLVSAQEMKVTTEPLSVAEQTQLSLAKQKMADAQLAFDKAVADYDATVISVVKSHGYEARQVNVIPNSPGAPRTYVTLADKNLIVHAPCDECK